MVDCGGLEVDGQGQLVTRVAAIIEVVDAAGAAGARLVDLARETGIARSSAHRTLSDLVSVGFVRQTSDRRYVIGARLAGLASVQAQAVFDVRKLEAVAQALAAETGDTVYVARRVGASARYLVRADGSYPVRAQLVEVGQVVSLGVTLSGIALLAGSADDELSAILRDRGAPTTSTAPVKRDARWLKAFKLFEAEVQSRGYCYVPNFVWPGVSGLAAPIGRSGGRPRLAISISAIAARMPSERAREIGPRLVQSAAELALIVG